MIPCLVEAQTLDGIVPLYAIGTFPSSPRPDVQSVCTCGGRGGRKVEAIMGVRASLRLAVLHRVAASRSSTASVDVTEASAPNPWRRQPQLNVTEAERLR